MRTILTFLRDFFRREEVEPFDPQADEFVQRMERERTESEESLQHRRDHRREWLSEPLSNRFRGYQQHEGDK